MFENKNFRLVEKFKIWVIISLSIILVGAGFMIGRVCMGKSFLNLGIDFTGGTVLTVETGEGHTAQNSDQVEDVIIDFLTAQGVEDFSPVQVSNLGTVDANIIVKFVAPSVERMKEIHPDIADTFVTDVNVIDYLTKVSTGSYGDTDPLMDSLAAILGAEETDTVTRLCESVSASASETLIIYTFLAILLAAFLILIYIAFRFRSFSSGFAAIVGLLHDVAIMLAIVAIIGLQVNTNFIAAVITIIGYSINNSIIIFDRIRETRRMDNNLAPTPLVNGAVKATMNRTINTTLTTLLPLLALAILGGTAIAEFIIPIIIGLFAGVWSSVFISPEFWAKLMEHSLKKRGDKSEYVKQMRKREKTEKAPKAAEAAE